MAVSPKLRIANIMGVSSRVVGRMIDDDLGLLKSEIKMQATFQQERQINGVLVIRYFHG